MLSLLQSSGMVEEGSLESSLEDIGLNVDKEHIIKVLETKYIPGENLIEFFSWASRRPGMALSTTMVEMLTRAICSGETMRDAYALWNLLKELGEKEIGVLSTHILNELISFFSRFAKGKAAYEVFNKFGDFGCEPNSDTYYFTIEAVSRRKIYDWASSVSEKMLGAQKLPDSCRVGKIISFLCKGDKARDAHLVYMAAKGN
ncbi:pentatricopeptide repeat-containing protein At3g02650, mitochondrial-like [Ipomoea triloba]|uniref:pentatricopeptide repeat-containing protein At3g02650, mitochondrial-like n=1 Tax=Ipomoea triloba TaxID=35885 RepID=UPI00125D171D|nr:pentatricopeptide repeat-containing protein At3g02650, mitochondrial-like [Ipomoea triloba]